MFYGVIPAGISLLFILGFFVYKSCFDLLVVSLTGSISKSVKEMEGVHFEVLKFNPQLNLLNLENININILLGIVSEFDVQVGKRL